jgi:hypothetical protein
MMKSSNVTFVCDSLKAQLPTFFDIAPSILAQSPANLLQIVYILHDQITMIFMYFYLTRIVWQIPNTLMRLSGHRWLRRLRRFMVTSNSTPEPLMSRKYYISGGIRGQRHRPSIWRYMTWNLSTGPWIAPNAQEAALAVNGHSQQHTRAVDVSKIFYFQWYSWPKT